MTRIDDGPVATVYSGHRAGMPVAIKVFPKRFDKRTMSAFTKEQAKLSTVRRTTSILMVDAVEQMPSGESALRMELCTQSLAGLVERAGPLSAADAAALGRAMATALSAAHSAGVVHGGVSPHNVLYRENNEPVVADFGITLRQAFPRDPLHGIEYLPPETLRAGTLNELTDLYGLGAVLHFALTARPLHPGEPVSAITRSDVPVGLSTLIARLLATGPEHRPQSAMQVADQLTPMLPNPPKPPPTDHWDDFAATPVPPRRFTPPGPLWATRPHARTRPRRQTPPIKAAPPIGPLATPSPMNAEALTAPQTPAPKPPTAPPTPPVTPPSAPAAAPLLVPSVPPPSAMAGVLRPVPSSPPAMPSSAPSAPASSAAPQFVSPQTPPAAAKAVQPDVAPPAAPGAEEPSSPAESPTPQIPPVSEPSVLVASADSSLTVDLANATMELRESASRPVRDTQRPAARGQDETDIVLPRPVPAGRAARPSPGRLPLAPPPRRVSGSAALAISRTVDLGRMRPTTVLTGALPQRPGRRRAVRYDLLVAAALVLVLLVLVPLLLRSDPAGTSSAPKVTVELAKPTDLTDKVRLSWTASRDLDFVVVVAEGEKTRVLLAERNHSMTVAVKPDRKYCFTVQASDGDQVYESEPQPLRGATCRT